MSNILIIGSINIDYGIEFDHPPKKGETIVGKNFLRTIGGKGLNQGVAAFKYNTNAYFCGSVGSDESGHYVINTLNELGFPTKYISISERTTGSAVILRSQGDNSIIIDEGANGDVKIENVMHAIKKVKPEYVVLQFEIAMELNREIMKYCKSEGIKVIVNTAPAQALEASDFQLIDIMILNQHETHFYSGIYPVDLETSKKASEFFINKGVVQTVITLGDGGCVYSNGDESLHIESFKADVKDTTGAGDAFVGVFASALSEIGDIQEALILANAAGSLACEKTGAMTASPFRDDIKKRVMEENK